MKNVTRTLGLFVAAGSLGSNAWSQDQPRVAFEQVRIGDFAAELGHLRVPENRSIAESAAIQLEFVRLHSTAADPGSPVFFLPGGPGNGCTGMAESPVWAGFLELGDVVLLDPRGVGNSGSDLAWSSDELSAELFFIDRETAVEHMAEMCALAAEDFEQRGIDITGYTTIELAEDVEDLRVALGYDAIHLFGHSFGTHLGLEILRRHPSSVARFVSVGTAGTGDMMKLPSDLDRSLAALSQAVAADPVVGEAVPDLRALVLRVVEKLRDEPLWVPVRHPVTGESIEVPLGDFGLQFLLVADLGDTSDLPVFPRLLTQLERGETRMVSWFLQKRLDQFTQLPGMMLAVRASSGADAARWEQIRKEALSSPFGLARCLFSPEADRALGVKDVGDGFRKPVESKVPTLFISGALDAHTPPFQAERVIAGFPNSGHIVVEYGGHEDLLPDPRVQELILGFLGGDDPEDVLLERPALRFAPLEGNAAGVNHPSVQ